MLWKVPVGTKAIMSGDSSGEWTTERISETGACADLDKEE